MMARLILGFAVILAARAEDCQADDSSLLSLRANSSEKYYSTGMIQWDKSGTWCLSVDNNDFSSGTKLQLWECGASDGQIFNFEFNMNEATVQTAKAQFMIDPESRSNGAGISLKPTSSNGQRWKWSSKYQYGSGGTGFLRLSGNDGYCLVIDGNNPYNGAKVQLWKCGDGGPSDKYWMPTTQTLATLAKERAVGGLNRPCASATNGCAWPVSSAHPAPPKVKMPMTETSSQMANAATAMLARRFAITSGSATTVAHARLRRLLLPLPCAWGFKTSAAAANHAVRG
mmetsp:Transcript_93364/g.166038  ORF Transcript_93364/g.166038 Transcript_93364/m.166038 type:complete len:286 (+) Transcript_93364:66-923(+)